MSSQLIFGTQVVLSFLASQGLSRDVQLGSAYYIPTFVVPALVITHLMMFGMLLRRPDRGQARFSAR